MGHDVRQAGLLRRRLPQPHDILVQGFGRPLPLIPYKYLHKDELSEDIVDYLRANDKSLPAVLLQENNNFRELVNKYQLDKCAGNVTCVWNLLRSEKSLDLEN